MFTMTKKRKAISTVLTTMIIVVASVVLATGVIIFGTSTFQNKANNQALTTTGTQIWIDKTGNSGWAWGAAALRNSGDKIFSIDQIQVHGQAMPYQNWYADTNQTRVTVNNYQWELNFTSINGGTGAMANGTGVGAPSGCSSSPGPLIMQLGSHSQNPTLCLTQQNGPLSLYPGQRAIVYFKVQQNLLTSLDASSPVSIAIYAGQTGSPVEVTAAAR